MKDMTRSILLLFVTLSLLSCYGCASNSYLPKDALFDETFVGIWKGELSLDNSDTERRWKKRRRPDGALTINIGLYSKDNVYLGREVISGFWWVQENRYFEKLPTLNHQVIAHTYTKQDDGSIKFIVQNEDPEHLEAYTFFEQKVKSKKE
jgi:hypothetical protein